MEDRGRLSGCSGSGLEASNKYHGEDALVPSTGALFCWLFPSEKNKSCSDYREPCPVIWS